MSAVVLYHGSHTDAHGVYHVTGTCPCDDCDNDRDVWDIHHRNHAANAEWPDPGPEPVRWVLQQAYPSSAPRRLEHVRAESFTPIRP